MTSINRYSKDRLFKALFGSEERKGLTLELYNAINDTSYTNPKDIQINTLEDVVYMGMKNDVSFLLLNTMNLYEQQSTENPNMPLRFFLYLAHLYEKYIDQNDLSAQLYGKKRIRLPAPHLVMLYNGTQKEEDRILRISDLFEENATTDLELQVHLLNINYEQDSDILKRCKSLRDYAFLVESYREGVKKGNRMQAVTDAISKMEDGPVRKYLQSHQKEVTGMLLEEYDEEKVKRYLYKEAWEEGLRDGLEQGLEQGLERGLEQGLEQGLRESACNMASLGIPVETIAKVVHASVSNVQEWISGETSREK